MGYNWKPENRQNKALVRENITVVERKIFNALLLPGDTQECLKSLIQKGSIGKWTNVIAIERNPMTASKIERYMRSVGVKGRVIISDLEDVDLQKELEGRKIDYCYFDTCCQLTTRLVGWLTELHATSFAANARLLLTFCNARDTDLVNRAWKSYWPDMEFGNQEETPNADYSRLQSTEVALPDAVQPEAPQSVLDKAHVTGRLLESIFGHKVKRTFIYCDIKTWMSVYEFDLNRKKNVTEFSKILKAVAA